MWLYFVPVLLYLGESFEHFMKCLHTLFRKAATFVVGHAKKKKPYIVFGGCRSIHPKGCHEMILCLTS